MTSNVRWWAGLSIGMLLVAAAHAAGGAYHVVRRYPVGGEGGWDYLTVDPAAHRLYVGRGDRVQVLDLEGGTVVGEVPGTPGVHGVALAPDLGLGFTSNGRDSTVSVFDLKTLAVRRKIPVGGRNPDAILFEPVTKRVFTMNAGSGTATAIDAVRLEVVGTFPLGGRPEFAVADGKGLLFVNLEDSSAVVRVDARSLAVGPKWPLVEGEGPSGLALDRAHHRLFSVCSNAKMVVLDSETGRVLATLPIGRGTDGAAFDPGTGLAFSSNGEGTVTVVREESPGRFRVAETDSTRRSARTIALDPLTHRVYVAAARFGEAPPPTPEHPRPRPPMVPGSFEILELDR